LPVWLCTYRLQINREFDFHDLAGIGDYLAALGVSHAYLSPILRAARGSTHGYDVVDASEVNPEWGGESAYLAASEALKKHGVGQVLDIVPNHMSIATPGNRWWWDVLEHGPGSPYLRYFDFGWRLTRHAFRPVQLPVLEDEYGRVLAAGKLSLARKAGGFEVRYADWAFPLSPASYALAVRHVAELAEDRELLELAAAFEQKTMASDELWRGLTDYVSAEANAAALDRGLERLNQDTPRVGEVLDRQYYRLVNWRTANEAFTYRRFFDVNTLAGVCIEQDDVFGDRHALELPLVRKDVVDGLRIDHIDGLRLPEKYLRSLRKETPAAGIWVEKILAPRELLPRDWPVEGTTGYDFLNVLNGLFVHPGGERALTEAYREFTGERRAYAEILAEAKRDVLHSLFGGELTDLADLLEEVCRRHDEARRFSRRDLKAVLVEYLVELPVYRTYAVPETVAHPEDVALIEETLRRVRKRLPSLGLDVFALIQGLLEGDVTGDEEGEFVLRLQQLSGPVMAKGAEDTAFYRYHRLVSLNEVGGEPAIFGTTLQRFHGFCQQMAEQWPRTLLAASTHDTKRGEDTRQRLNVLSEAPERWAAKVREWSGILASLPQVDSNTTYLFFQTMIGAWPLDVDRATEYMLKAAREAKRETSWLDPDAEYENRLRAFVHGALENAAFVASVEDYVRDIDRDAAPRSLAQTLIKLTAPGVPDIYQGCEVMSYTLVDPDNRRPVDYERLRALLREAQSLPSGNVVEVDDADLKKLWLTWTTLSVRTRNPEAFAGSYRDLFADGPASDAVVAYLRADSVCVVALRWSPGSTKGLENTALTLPEGRWRDAISGCEMRGRLAMSSLPRRMPLALLEKLSEL
jgi:(1->4)-alpha-D-glucan 1-alpha-D-glucosylmutase